MINKKNMTNLFWILLYIIILPFLISIAIDFFYISITSYADILDYERYGPSGIYKIKHPNTIYTVLHLKTIILFIILSLILSFLSIFYKKRFILIFIDILMSFIVINTVDFIINFTDMLLLCECSLVTLSITSSILYKFQEV